MILSPPHILFVALSATIANVDQVRIHAWMEPRLHAHIRLAASPVHPSSPHPFYAPLTKPKNNQVAGWIGSVHGPTQVVVSDFRPVPLKYHFIDNEGMYVTFVTFKCDACVSTAAGCALQTTTNATPRQLLSNSIHSCHTSHITTLMTPHFHATPRCSYRLFDDDEAGPGAPKGLRKLVRAKPKGMLRSKQVRWKKGKRRGWRRLTERAWSDLSAYATTNNQHNRTTATTAGPARAAVVAGRRRRPPARHRRRCTRRGARRCPCRKWRSPSTTSSGACMRARIFLA